VNFDFKEIHMIRLRLVFLALAACAFLPLSNSAAAQSAPPQFNSCKVCHSVAANQNGVGPSLWGVVGRNAGSAAGYRYSSALVHFGKNYAWTEGELLIFLGNPRSAVPGTKMMFGGFQNSADVQGIIAYLRTQSTTRRAE
jgi:cytochrome c